MACTCRRADRSSFRTRRTGRSELAVSCSAPSLHVSHKQCIVTLLASHISSARRLKYLQYCLRSIAEQSDPPAALYLSWYADDELAVSVSDTFAKQSLPLRFVPLQQKQQLSQYEHLSRALHQAEKELPAAPTSTWLMFSDDDDLWHPQRTALVRKACVAHPSCEALAFSVYAHPAAERSREVTSSAEVDRALDARTAGLWVGASEIFQYAVRPDALARFLQAEPRSVRQHKFCDVRFSQFLRHQLGHKGAFAELDARGLMRLCGMSETSASSSAAQSGWLAQHWLYFYRQTRHLGETRWLQNLDDMRSFARESTLAAASRGASTEHDRASTGLHLSEADWAAARTLLGIEGNGARRKGGRAMARGPAEQERALASEIARMRHHAELSVMMCLHVANTAELAVAICEQGAEPHPDPETGKILRAEQARLVREACDKFGHGTACRGKLPIGTLDDCLS